MMKDGFVTLLTFESNMKFVRGYISFLVDL